MRKNRNIICFPIKKVQLSVVVPNGREYPYNLIDDLLHQVKIGDEILIITNGVQTKKNLSKTFTNEQTSSFQKIRVKNSKIQNVFVSHSPLGAAAARNKGWSKASNEWILFLDDDIRVSNNLLDMIREFIYFNDKAGLYGLRVKDLDSGHLGSDLFKQTLSLDRGPKTYSTKGKPLRLYDTWRFGVGAALLVNKKVLLDTGGFKDWLGTGRPFGGSEDLEFIWHASFHKEVAYIGNITVLHRNPNNIPQVCLKMLQYGQALGALGGVVQGNEGLRLVINYCMHLRRVTQGVQLPNISRFNLLRVRLSSWFAIYKTLYTFVIFRLKKSARKIRCNFCN
jgi:glycosyltransferase involved in cell wall biosynthesis